MGFVSDILGLGGSEGTPGQVVDTTPDEFVGLRRPVADVLKGFLTGSAPSLAGIPTAPGPFVAGPTAMETDLLGRVGSFFSQPSPASAASRDLLGQTLRGDFLRPESNPFLQSTIEAAQRPLRRQFEEVTIPNLRSRFTASGQMIQPGGSSPFDRAAALAQGDFLNASAEIATNITGQNFQAERGRQQQAVAQAIQLSQADLDNMVQGLRAVALPRLIEQGGLDKGLAAFNQRVDTLLRALALAQGASSAQPVVLQPTPGTQGEGLAGLVNAISGIVKLNPFGWFA